ncbi:MAG: TetR family transcriptional regulator C-terminal domain-containing protein [Steroidobacteraceae bacterium]
MTSRKRKLDAPARAPRAGNGPSRQRQRLIDACISALHIYGPSRTTVEKVVAIAKMSPGIVRFYFDSKAAMLVASLQFLAAEFEEQVLVPVSKLKERPVAALELMVNLYLDPDIASPRKVSVWYAFWGEASSRQEYYDICGQKDESFAALVRELIGRLIDESAQPQLDPGAIALGLIGVLEMLWQDFAFQPEGNIDRQAAQRRAMAYLRSIFPRQFSPLAERVGADAHSAAQAKRFAGWVYGNARAFAMERDALFQSAWQIAGHESQIRRAGDFLTVDTGVERALLVRDAFGSLHALRNSCPERPHTLAAERSGRFEGAVECKIHGLKFRLDGRRADAGTGADSSVRADLSVLDLQVSGGLLIVRSPKGARAAALSPAGGWVGKPPHGLMPLGPALESAVAADWKVLVEQWLERAAPEAAPNPAADVVDWVVRPADEPSWSSQRYRRLAGAEASNPWQMRFVAPNQLLESRPDGVSILQVLPSAPGRCRLRRLDYTLCAAERGAHALQYLASRLSARTRRSALALAESVQQGVIDFGYRPAALSPIPTAVSWFRRHLIARIPALALERPPTDP